MLDFESCRLAPRRLAVAAAACQLVACTWLATADQAPVQPAAPVAAPAGASLSFEHEGTLTLAPAELATLSVRSKPPGAYEVTFYLVGPALDASLDRTVAVADAQSGRASVTLRAPGGATSFAVRAALAGGGASAELPVSVSSLGFGTLDIRPVYDGSRAAREWVASVVAGTTCEALTPALPADPEGALGATAEPGDPLLVPNAPVGPNLAVLVRGGHFMWGCTDVPNLAANETTEVKVFIVNRPISLGEEPLEIELGFVPDPAEPWTTLLGNSTQLMLDAFLDPNSSESAGLIAQMAKQASEPAAFDQASAEHAWEDVVDEHLAANGIAIVGTIKQLVAQALDPGIGTIGGAFQHAGDSKSFVLFTLDRLGSVPAPLAGAPTDYLMSWTVDPDDTVRLGGTLFWLPSRFLGSASSQLLEGQYPDGMLGLLPKLVRCDELGEKLGGYESCPADCMAELCRSALAARWSAALDASATSGLVGTVAIQASGAARFDDAAGLTGFDGAWLGSATNGLLSAKVHGSALASLANEPEPEQ
ncbi:MAG: hypothetical protein HY744_22370 [Deltaproteobacteria bacterium]|nr:hypothetical protein [Deltaproteobacteria bacterium]